MAFYETEGKPELIEKYFSLVRENSEQMRRACSPAVSPIDALRCTLDEVWEPGAHLQTFNGRKMFVGLSRMVEPGTTFLAHHDIFEQDAKGAPEATSVLAQFGANVYAQVPETGGELLMWDMNMSSEEFDHRRQGEYGLRVETLPPPDIAINWRSFHIRLQEDARGCSAHRVTKIGAVLLRCIPRRSHASDLLELT